MDLLKSTIDKYIYLILSFSAILAIYSFPPYSMYLFIFIGYFFLFYSFYIAKGNKEAFLYGFVFGLSYFSIGLYWLFSIMLGYEVADSIIIGLIVIFIILILSIFIGILGVFSQVYNIKQKNFSFWITIALPIYATLMEYLRSTIFTGFPWYRPADSIFDIGFSSILPIGGVDLLNFIFFIIIGVFVHLFIYKNRNIIYISSIFVLILISIYISKSVEYTYPLEKKALNIHLVNGNFDKKDKKDRYKTLDRIKEFSSLALLEPTPDISIWPESTLSTGYKSISAHLEAIIHRLNQNKIQVFTGAYIEKRDKVYNTIYSLTNKEISYSKQHLIPFGEYTPSWLEAFKAFIPSMFMDNLSIDSKQNHNIDINGVSLSPSICYEILFSNNLRQKIKDSNILVHISDLGWFEQYWAKSYLSTQARMRAIESQKPMIYVVNKGISAFIDKNGEVIKNSKFNIQESLYNRVTPYKGNTLYIKYGSMSLFAYIFIMWILFKIFNRSTKWE